MASENGNGNGYGGVATLTAAPATNSSNGTPEKATWRSKVGLAEMLKGGVIMDVVNAEQAKIAEEAGATAVMALERVPADIRKDGGVARMSDPRMIKEIMDTVTIPVMAKARIGHIIEARILEALGVDFIDESEVLTPADEQFHIYKHDYKVPFVCGCRDLGEALRRIGEGRGDDSHQRRSRNRQRCGGRAPHEKPHGRHPQNSLNGRSGTDDGSQKLAGAPYELVLQIAQTGKLPVPNFSARAVWQPPPMPRS